MGIDLTHLCCRDVCVVAKCFLLDWKHLKNYIHSGERGNTLVYVEVRSTLKALVPSFHQVGPEE